MTKAEALRFLVAAQDDPVLAAWAWVLHEYRANAHCDVPPHEHWEAFQSFFTHGLVSPVDYDRTDVKHTFFSGQRPRSSDVQQVLENVKLLCPGHLSEDSMSKAKPPVDAFATSSAIAPRPAGGLASAPQPNQLSRAAAPAAVEAFRPQQEVLPASKQPAGLQPFAQEPRGLPCNTPNEGAVDARAYRGIEINLEIKCCGRPMKIIDDGGDILGPESVPETEHSLLEYMFHGECEICNTMYHCSAGKPIPRDAY